MAERTRQELQMLQALPLEVKIAKTQQRIREWVKAFTPDGCYIAFSGGKDSTVLLHLVRQLYPEIEAVFVNTGLEYPEIQKFAKSFENVTVLTPKKNFKQVITEYGYPVLSKDISNCFGDVAEAKNKGRDITKLTKYQKIIGTYKIPNTDKISPFNLPEKYRALFDVDFQISAKCCGVMKKKPAFDYGHNTGKTSIVGTMAEESTLRLSAWLRTGCNLFEGKHKTSKPMSFWTEQDVLQYIKEENIPIASVYGDIIPENNQLTFDGCDCRLCTTGCDRTGCIFCGYGVHLEKESRFLRLKKTHPKQYNYCINGGAYDEQGIWKPNDKGLGMGHVFDELNKLYGDDFIRYK